MSGVAQSVVIGTSCPPPETSANPPRTAAAIASRIQCRPRRAGRRPPSGSLSVRTSLMSRASRSRWRRLAASSSGSERPRTPPKMKLISQQRPWSCAHCGARSGLRAVLRGSGAGAGGVVVLVADLRALLGAGGAGGADRGHRAQQDLADVEHLDVLAGLAVLLLGVQRVRQHRDAERAGGGDDVGIERERLLGALGVDPL